MAGFAMNSPGIASLAWPNRTSYFAWLEFANKLDAFRSFATADCRTTRSFTDSQVVGCAQRLAKCGSAFSGLWATEGLGYEYAIQCLRSNASPRALMSHLEKDLPFASTIPLHTGMGLAFARHELKKHSVYDRVAVRNFVTGFLKLCTDNSVRGLENATFEALGLIVQLLRPSILRPVDEFLRGSSAELTATFWHGVGRGMYFAPFNVLPCTAVARPGPAMVEVPHEICRQNLVSGWAWAVTLVNVRSPQVVEIFLNRQRPVCSALDIALADGIWSAAAVWHEWAADDHHLDGLCDSGRANLNEVSKKYWKQNGMNQCKSGFHNKLSDFRSRNRLGDLFRVSGQSAATPIGL